MEGADSTGRHEGDRFGGWMAEIGRADTGKAGFVDGVMRGKNKKAVRPEGRTAEKRLAL